MKIAKIREHLRKDPFEPFEIRVRNGDIYQVRKSTQVALGKSRIFFGRPDDDFFEWADESDIVSVEPIPVFEPADS